MIEPAPSELNEFNRILGAVQELSGEGDGCEIRAITILCSSVTFGGRPSNHYKIIRLAHYAGLLARHDTKYNISPVGEEFLDCNIDSTFEVSEEQKSFVAVKLILNGPWRKRAKNVLLLFDPNYKKVSFEFDTLNKEIPLYYTRMVHLLRHLDVIKDHQGILRVEPNYVAIIANLRRDVSTTSIHDLEEALEAQRKTGDFAEDAVVEFERERLNTLGKDVEATLVRKISQLDVSAGYDVQSYDGDKPLVDYDRFIEVKGSQYEAVRFYWTANERRVAENLGSNYWIYFVPNVKPSGQEPINPILFNDPFNQLEKIDSLSIEPSTYLITQVED